MTQINKTKVDELTKIINNLNGQDKEDFITFALAYREGDKKSAKCIADSFDTFLREEIPVHIWKELGGKLTPKGEADMMRTGNGLVV